MQRNRFFPVLVTTILAGSFAAGVFEPELQARGGLPELFSNLRPGANGAELDPLNTYTRVLEKVRTRFVGDLPSEKRLTHTAVRGLLNSLDDPYTRFLDPEEYRKLREENLGEFVGIGAQLETDPTPEGYIRISRPLPNTPAALAGVKRRDLISKVDGKSVVGMDVDKVVSLIRGQAGTPVKLTLIRAGAPKPIELTIVRRAVEFEVVESRMLDGNIGYISLAQFNEVADKKIERHIRELERQPGGLKGLILDLRGNPGGLLDAAIDISSRFVPQGRGVVTIVESGGQREQRRSIPQKYLGGKWPLVVLVNRTSASASEIVSGAVKDNGAGTVVGTTTFGKGLVQTVVPLADGSACMITTAKYLTPSGKDINRSKDSRGGVEPDIVVEMTEKEYLANRDPQLRKALDVLHERTGQRPAGSPASASR